MGDMPDREEREVYAKLLNIPPSESAPNHYALLGISPNEQDAKVIEAAARKRSEQLRSSKSTEVAHAARHILKRIQRAQTCLLDPQARASYNIAVGVTPAAEVKNSIWDELDSIPAPSNTKATSSSVGTKSLASLPTVHLAPQRRGLSGTRTHRAAIGAKRSASRRTTAIYVSCGIAMALIVALAAFLMRRDSAPDGIASNENSSLVITDATKNSSSRIDGSTSGTILPKTGDTERSRDSDKQSSRLNPGTSQQDDALTSFQSRRVQDIKQNSLASNLGNSSQPAISDVTGSGEANSPLLESPPIDFLSTFSDAISLPPQRASDSALGADVNKIVNALVLGSAPSEGLSIAIDQPAAMNVDGIRFEVNSDPTQTTGSAWEVRLKSIAQLNDEDEQSSLDVVAVGLDEVVARVFVENGELKFVWANPRHSQLADQLRNCVLCLQHAGQTHRVQMRPYESVSPVVLDFEKSVVNISLDGDTLPPPDATFLEVQASQALLANASIEPETGTVPCNKVLKIKLLQDKNKQVEIQIMLRNRETGYSVIIGPRFRIGTSLQPFTTDRVNDGLRGLVSALERHRAELANARQMRNSLSGEISSVQARISSSQDDREIFQLRNQLRGLQSRRNREDAKIKRKERSIPETESDIEIMKSLAEVGNRLRGYAELKIRVGVRTSNGEFDLLRTDETLAQATELPLNQTSGANP